MPVEDPRGKPNPPTYAAAGPYPPIRVQELNPAYARMLKMDADSARSEVTSSMQYIYQSWVLSLQNEALSEMLRGIAIVEMRHLDILGRLIAQLGGNPGYAVLQQGRPVSWNGSMVSYTQQPDRMLEGNILLEQHAVDTYTQQIAHIKDPYVVDVLKRILLDEQLHLELFRSSLQQLRGQNAG